MLGFIKKWLSKFIPEPVDVVQLKKEGSIIIDVRTPQEFKGGKLKGAKNFPVQTIHQNIDKIKKLNKNNKTVILYCRSGGRAGRALGILRKNGIEAVNAGGYSQLRSILG